MKPIDKNLLTCPVGNWYLAIVRFYVDIIPLLFDNFPIVHPKDRGSPFERVIKLCFALANDHLGVIKLAQ